MFHRLLPLVMAVCAVLGVVNGVLVAYAGLPSLAVTLGTMGAYRGLAFLMAGDAGVTGITDDYLLIRRMAKVPITCDRWSR